MRLHVNVIAITWSVASTVTTPTVAFVPNLVTTTTTATSRDPAKATCHGTATKATAVPHSRLLAHNHDHNVRSTISKILTDETSTYEKNINNNHHAFVNAMKQWTMAALVATTIWASPAAMAPYASHAVFNDNSNNIMNNMGAASAKDKASGSGSRVNKDPESLLRYGLPIQNKEVRQLQGVIELINTDISSKRKSAALDGVQKSRLLLGPKSAAKMVASCRDAAQCEALVSTLADDLKPLEVALQDSKEAFNGSEQERTALDQAYAVQKAMTKTLTTLEEQMVPKGYQTIVPPEYSDLPQLQGRATVEMTFQKEDKAPFNVQGVNYPTAKLVMVIDGYNAPITGGNFVDLVQKGFYTNMKIQRSDGFVVQTGKPDTPEGANGYVGTPGKAIGAGPKGERLIPLELTLVGDKGPLYESTIEEYGRGGEATVLPFSAYGAMGWAREEYDPNTGSSQFFWLLFDSDLTPAGKNLLDGNYPCFGYVVEGADLLADIKEGDIITSCKVTSGIENLKKGV